MDEESNLVRTDALLKPDDDDINKILPKQIGSIQINSVLDDLTVEEYKSMLFLLMDHINEDEFMNIIKQDKTCLRQKIDEVLEKNNQNLLIELLGTLKLYDKLKTLRTCYHTHKKVQNKFDNIDGVW